MPMYHYRCSNCGTEMEVQQRITESALTDCPTCETSALKRVIGLGGGFVLKGTGFYNTDYKNAGKTNGKDKTAETKADSKPEPVHTCGATCTH